MKVNREMISLARGEVGRHLGNGEFGRDQPVKVDEMVLALSLGQLHQEKHHVDADEGVVDHRNGFGWGGVANGYHRSIDYKKMFWTALSVVAVCPYSFLPLALPKPFS
jgi:hypothetical protein